MRSTYLSGVTERTPVHSLPWCHADDGHAVFGAQIATLLGQHVPADTVQREQQYKLNMWWMKL
jgi:hypothetical protein